MAGRPLSLSIQNAGTSPRVVILEPWGWEFTLDVDEKLEVTAQPGPGEPSLRLVEADRRTLIFAAGCSNPCVTQEGPTRSLTPTALAVTTNRPPMGIREILDPMWDRDLDD
jgi:hypothetical protein